MTRKNNVKAGGFPKCPEVCNECRDGGKHIFHILSEEAYLIGIYAEGDSKWTKSQKYIRLEGHAEDELWLENLLKHIAGAYSK